MDEANNAVTMIFFFALKWHYDNIYKGFTNNAFTYNT